MPTAEKRCSDNRGKEEDEEEYEEGSLSAQQPQLEHEDPDADSEGSPSFTGDQDTEFAMVKLSDIRKEVQCPICLGIIRKTRTVMQCLHRFCRECIDKSMRLGNNECPACRTHCASRRSLRDDPNYDALIAALYPDIDKYEEEELAFREEEKACNKQIQSTIAGTFQRQSEALGRRRSMTKATAAAFMRKSQDSFRNTSNIRRRNRHSRETGHPRSDEDEEDTNGEGNKASFPDEPSPDVRQKRYRRWPAPWFSLATGVHANGSCDEADNAEVGRESTSASPGHVRTPDLVWGRGGMRSHTHYGSSSGSNGKNPRSGRVSKFVDYLRNLDENEDEISIQAEELEVFVEDSRRATAPQCGSAVDEVTSMDDTAPDTESDIINEDEWQMLGEQDTVGGLHANYMSGRGNLVLVYRSKSPKG